MDENILVGRLTGSVRCKVATVRKGKKYFMVAPKKLGGIQEIPADSLTDCLNFGVWLLNEEKKAERGKNGHKVPKDSDAQGTC